MSIRIFKLNIIILLIIVSCSDNDCVKISDNLNTKEFIKNSDRGSRSIIYFGNNLNVELPKNERYIYFINNNFIVNDTIYIKRIDKTSNYNYVDILKIKKDSIYHAFSTRRFDSNFRNNKLIDIFFSQGKDKIALLYHIPNSKSMLKIVSSEGNNVILKKVFSKRFYLQQSPWNKEGDRILLYNYKKEIYVLDLNSKNLMKLPVSGLYPIWISPQNKISYLNTNTLRIYDFDSGHNKKLFKIKNRIFSTSNILDYYWFPDQNKFYIKVRFTNRIIDKLWNNEYFIIRYDCN